MLRNLYDDSHLAAGSELPPPIAGAAFPTPCGSVAGRVLLPPPVPVLQHLLGDGARFAVVDLETTGLYNADKVVEIAVVTVGIDGSVLDEWTTLVDPGRDVGPSHIHGITASDVAGAPRFEDIAEELALRLHGARLVAHNLYGFDIRMLRNEFGRLRGFDIDLGRGLDTLVMTGAKLPVACDWHGIQLDSWHAALDDARAAAALFKAAACETAGPTPPGATRAGAVRSTPVQVRLRTGTSTRTTPSWFAQALATLPLDQVPVDERPYLDLLERVVADWRVTVDEQAALENLAHELGLTPHQQRHAHGRFLDALIDAALDDGVVTSEELAALLATAELLDVEPGRVMSRTAEARQETMVVRLGVPMTVCFTGEALIDGEVVDRQVLAAKALAVGLEPVPSVTKATQLLVAADPATQSGKAAKAHRYGIPVVAASDLYRSQPGAEIPAVITRIQEPKTHICPKCGLAIVIPPGTNRPAIRACASCRQTDSRPTSTSPRTTKSEGTVEELTCTRCDGTWTRPVVRGRKPKRCPACAT